MATTELIPGPTATTGSLEAAGPRAAAAPEPLTTAERAECTCPEFCERDHEQD